MKYTVVVEESQKELEEKVNDLLSQSWELQGGVCVFWHRSDNTYYFAQALIYRKVS